MGGGGCGLDSCGSEQEQDGAVVDTVTNIRVLQNAGNVLTNRGYSNF